VVGFNTGKYDVNAMKIDLFTRLVESEGQVYRETELQFHVYQDRGAEISRHHQLYGTWI
jgi:hypothetical protein